eukprot:1158344-Pelagomonas_calceolata.AAC.7
MLGYYCQTQSTHAGVSYCLYTRIPCLLCAHAQSDLLVALGVRFDDRVTGKLETFAQRATIVHIDIDTAEIGKNKVRPAPAHSP